MAAQNGVVDTSVFKGIADLHAGVMSDDPVVAPAHEVVHDSDMVADLSMPSDHGDAVADHSGDTASTSTEDASAGDAGHVHADLAYADTDHAYADVDHAYADADHAVVDMDHAYADHAYADATVPDSAVFFADHPMVPADDGMPHSLGADAAKGQGDGGQDNAAWWWAGGAAAGGVGLGLYLSHEENDTSHSSSGSPDVHVVVESSGAYIDTNHDGVYEDGAAVAVFGVGGNASLAANDVTIHFNDLPNVALNLTGFGEHDKIEFHLEALMGDNTGGRHILPADVSYLADLHVETPLDSFRDVHYTLNYYSYTFSLGGGPLTAYSSPQVEIHQHHATVDSSATDFAGNTYNGIGAFYMSVSEILSNSGKGTWGAIAYWTDADNALNQNSLLLPNYCSSTPNTPAVLDNLNANNEGGVVDFIWPAATTPN